MSLRPASDIVHLQFFPRCEAAREEVQTRGLNCHVQLSMPGHRTFAQIRKHLARKWDWTNGSRDILLFLVDGTAAAGAETCVMRRYSNLSVKLALSEMLVTSDRVKLYYSFAAACIDHSRVDSPVSNLSAAAGASNISPKSTADVTMQSVDEHIDAALFLEDSLCMALAGGVSSPCYHQSPPPFEVTSSSAECAAERDYAEDSLLFLITEALGSAESSRTEQDAEKEAPQTDRIDVVGSPPALSPRLKRRRVECSDADHSGHSLAPSAPSPARTAALCSLEALSVLEEQLCPDVTSQPEVVHKVARNPRNLRRIRPTLVALPHQHGAYVQLMQSLRGLASESEGPDQGS